MSSSSSLLDSSASSILGASTWIRRKDGRPVPIQQQEGAGGSISQRMISVGDAGEGIAQIDIATGSTSENNNNNNNNDNDDDNRMDQLLKKRIYPWVEAKQQQQQQHQTESSESTAREKTELESAVLLDCLSNNFLFSHLPKAEIQSLLPLFEPIKFRKNEIIFRRGEPSQYFYILYQGDVGIQQQDSGKYISIADSDGSLDQAESDGKYVVLGELALLTSSPYESTVKSMSKTCTLFRLCRAHFHRALRPEAQHMSTLEERIQTLKMAIPTEMAEYLHDDNIALKKLASGMSTHCFQKGDVLYKKGCPMKAFVIISKGLVMETEMSVGGRSYEDMKIGPGESQTSFGWQTTVSGTIVAMTDGIALVITKEAFGNATGHPVVTGGEITLHHLAQRRLARIQLQQITVFKDSSLDDTQINGLLDLMHHCEYAKGDTIFKAGEKIEAAMYIVREGSVTLEMDRGRIKQTIEEGGYFGEKNMLLDQNKDGHKHFEIRSPMGAIANSNTKIDILYLEECRKVVNTTLLGLGKQATISAIDHSIALEDLTRHALLGSGSYGQVWLASKVSPDPDGSDNTTEEKDGSNRRIVALKVQAKYRLVDSDKAEQVVVERNVLASLHSPFIIRLYNAFQDESRLYMVTSLLQGGELDSLIPEEGLSEEVAKFYAAGILEGLSYMHRRHVIHRDIKPENVLINSKGYPVLIDFGFAKYVPDKTYTFCGSPMIMAPEIIRSKGHDKACDNWSWGVLVYKMVTGKYPFYEKGMIELSLYKKICRGTFELDGVMTMEFRMLMVAILYPDPTKRLGSRTNGWRDIFDSPWFANDDSFNLKRLHRQDMPAPWIPDLKDGLDASRFHPDSSEVDDLMTQRLPTVNEKQQAIFDSFGPLVSSTECPPARSC